MEGSAQQEGQLDSQPEAAGLPFSRAASPLMDRPDTAQGHMSAAAPSNETTPEPSGPQQQDGPSRVSALTADSGASQENLIYDQNNRSFMLQLLRMDQTGELARLYQNEEVWL